MTRHPLLVSTGILLVSIKKIDYIVLVELLAYQFASPVRWIKTQGRLFVDFAFELFIEIGPSSTLTGMAAQTLELSKQSMKQRMTPSHTSMSFFVTPRMQKRSITNLKIPSFLQ